MIKFYFIYFLSSDRQKDNKNKTGQNRTKQDNKNNKDS